MKKSNLIKLIVAIIVIIAAIIAFFVMRKVTTTPVHKGEKVITVTIDDQVDHKVIMKDKKFDTDSKTLLQFLESEKSFKTVTTETKWGPFIKSLVGLETKDMNKGPWWMYGYDSPSQHINDKVGSAPVASKVNLTNGDTVTLVFTNNM